MLVKANKLVFDHIVDISTRTGVIKLNKKRMMLTSTESFGHLRRDLINTLGVERAKSILMRFGWSSGYSAAKAIKDEFPWRSSEELILAGPALHTLAGPVMVETEEISVDNDTLYMRGSWFYSHEYEEHVKHFGFSEEQTCWTLIGYVKGYLAGVYGKDVVVYEEQCRGKKDLICTFVACTIDLCPPEYLKMAESFGDNCLVSKFDDMYKQLEETKIMMQHADMLVSKMTNVLLKDGDLSLLLLYLSEEIGFSTIAERTDVRKPFEAHFIEKDHQKIYSAYMKGKVIAADQFVEVFAVKSEQHYYGKVIVVGAGQLTVGQRMIVERSITCFLWYFNARHKTAEKQWQRKWELLNDLIQHPNLEVDGSVFDIAVTNQHRAFVIKSDVDELYVLYLFLEKLVDDLFIAEDRIVVFMSNERGNQKASAELLLQKIMEAFPKNKVYIGIGRECISLQELATSYEEASKLCDFLVHCSKKQGQFAYYEELKHVLLFLKTADPAQLTNYYRQTIGSLIDYDKKNEAELLMTLQRFFDFNGNINKTAQNLNLSIPGLRYRLEKIESLIDTDLKSGDGRFQCQLALQFYYAVQTISS